MWKGRWQLRHDPQSHHESNTDTQALRHLHGENAKLGIYLTLPQDEMPRAAAIQRSRTDKSSLRAWSVKRHSERQNSVSRHSPPQRPNNQPGVEGGPAKGTQSYSPGGTMVLSVQHSPDCSPGKVTSGQMSPTPGNTACLRTALPLQWLLNSFHRLATQGCSAHWTVNGGRMQGGKKKDNTNSHSQRLILHFSLTH